MVPTAHLFVFPERQWQRLCRGLLFLSLRFHVLEPQFLVYSFLPGAESSVYLHISEQLRCGRRLGCGLPPLPSRHLGACVFRSEAQGWRLSPECLTGLWHCICDTGHCHKLDLLWRQEAITASIWKRRKIWQWCEVTETVNLVISWALKIQQWRDRGGSPTPRAHGLADKMDGKYIIWQIVILVRRDVKTRWYESVHRDDPL